ncbi:MAG: hypothetical protein R6U89_02225 [Dehalococcoidia bacterium]
MKVMSFLVVLLVVCFLVSVFPACDGGDGDGCKSYSSDKFLNQFDTIISECGEGKCHPFADRVALCELYRAFDQNPVLVWMYIASTYEDINKLNQIIDRKAIGPLIEAEEYIEELEDDPDFMAWREKANQAMSENGPLPTPPVSGEDIINYFEDETELLADLDERLGRYPSLSGIEIAIDIYLGPFTAFNDALDRICNFTGGFSFLKSAYNIETLRYDPELWPQRDTGRGFRGKPGLFNAEGYCVSWGYWESACEGDKLVLKECRRDRGDFCGSWAKEKVIHDCGEAGCVYDYRGEREELEKFIVKCSDEVYDRYRHPAGDHWPDETFDLSSDQPLVQSSQISEPGTPCGNGSPCAVAASPSANVAVLARGFPSAAGELLEHNGIDYNLVDVSLASSPALMRYPVLVIPSGGLYGMDSSPSFKRSLESYAGAGGVIIAMDKAYGPEYRALPGGNLDGKGYQQDISCRWRSTNLSSYSPLLAGQNRLMSDIKVDGYFTAWPENAEILLTERETKDRSNCKQYLLTPV